MDKNISGNQFNQQCNSNQFVPAICTQCGAKLVVDPHQEAAVCQYCGTPFIVQKAINNYNINFQNIQNTYNTQIGKKGIAQSAFEYLDRQQERVHQQEMDARRRQEEAERQKRILDDQKRERRKKGWATFGKVLLWIYFFPFMLTIFLYKNEKLQPKVKYGLIVALWLFILIYLLFGHNNQSDGPNHTSSLEDSITMSAEELQKNKSSSDNTTRNVVKGDSSEVEEITSTEEDKTNNAQQNISSSDNNVEATNENDTNEDSKKTEPTETMAEDNKNEEEIITKEEQEKILKESVRNLCAVEPGNDAKINEIINALSNQTFIISGYIACVTEKDTQSILLIRVGKYAEKKISGPDFQIKCNDLSELPYSSSNNLELKPGLSIDIEGSIGKYDEQTDLIELLPKRITSKGKGYDEKPSFNLTSQSTIKSVQTALNKAGYDCGTPDGNEGKRTYDAIEKYKKDRGLSDTYKIDAELAEYLRIIPTEEEVVVAAAAGAVAASSDAEQIVDDGNDYILNTNSKKFHIPGCHSADKIKPENRREVHKTREEILGMGYDPCGNCNP